MSGDLGRANGDLLRHFLPYLLDERGSSSSDVKAKISCANNSGTKFSRARCTSAVDSSTFSSLARSYALTSIAPVGRAKLVVVEFKTG